MPVTPDAKRAELRPLPMRITQLQFDRLLEARERDGMSIQEHIRRGLDVYLAQIEKSSQAQVANREAQQRQQSAAPPVLPTNAPPTNDRGPMPVVRQR